MKIRHFLAASSLFAALGAGPVAAEWERYVSQISNAHVVAARWGSSVDATGGAYMIVDRDAGRIVELVMRIEGLDPETLAAAGHHGSLGAIHIHNYPQGGPNFFVQQLPGDILPTATGFEFRLTDWVVEDPKVGPEGGAAFVLDEIAAGNAYFGLHTAHKACPNNPKPEAQGACSAPATALSGHLQALPMMEDRLLALYAE